MMKNFGLSEFLTIAVLAACSPRTFAWNVQPRSSAFRNAVREALTLSLAGSNDEATAVSDTVVVPTVDSIATLKCKFVPEGDFVPEPLIDGVVLGDDDDSNNGVDISLVVGRGNSLPGLHTWLLDNEWTLGEQRTRSMDAGWGSHNPDLVATVAFADSGLEPSQVVIGTQLYIRTANGPLPCVVTKITDTSFTMDANPPLAGASYRATVSVQSILPSPQAPTVEPYPIDFGTAEHSYRVATFALGCFWGAELMYMREPGVVGTAVGYTQGGASSENPSYEQVCSGTTGHTEAVAVIYDESQVSYEKLVHLTMDRLGEDKYLLNQVGNDRGTQYRHGVYYHTDEQKEIAKAILDTFGSDCQTECLPAQVFWAAEDYHQQYLLKGGQSARKGDTSVIRCYG